MEKLITCRNCGVTVEVAGDTDETDGPEEVEQIVTCPACSKRNAIMWPRNESGWYIFAVRLVEDGDLLV